MAAEGISAQHLDRLSADREQARVAALAAWRRAEAAVYPSVMVNATLYQQYIQVVRAIVDELGDVRTEDDLVVAWHERRGLGTEMVQPAVALDGDDDGRRPRSPMPRSASATARSRASTARRSRSQRLETARRRGDEWVVLFDDVTPFGSHRLEMHVRSGRALHASAQTEPTGEATYELEVVQLDPRDGAWLLDKPPLMPSRRYTRHDEWEARIAHARELFGKD